MEVETICRYNLRCSSSLNNNVVYRCTDVDPTGLDPGAAFS